MGRTFHESYSQAEVKPPSERATGLVFAVLALIVAGLWRNSPMVPWVALVATLVAGNCLLSKDEQDRRLVQDDKDKFELD
jgi:hypothetical protein